VGAQSAQGGRGSLSIFDVARWLRKCALEFPF
jgi:hypothetical protein